MQLRLTEPSIFTNKDNDIEKLIWNASKADLIELIVGIVGSKLIMQSKGEPINYAQAIAVASQLFDISLDGFYAQKTQVLMRKSVRHPTLDRLMVGYDEEADAQFSK